MMKKILSFNIHFFVKSLFFLVYFGINSKYSLYKLYPRKTFNRENKIHLVIVTSDPDPESDLDPDPYQNETDPKHW